MLYLNDNVYLVSGKINAAFYDFNNRRLVHVNSEAKELLLRILGKSSELTNNEREYLDSLASLGLLTDKYTNHHDIYNLKEEPVIDFVWVEVTNLCNLKCIHCYNESEPVCGQIMPYSDFCYIIDNLEAYGIKKIQIIGGEPLMLGDRITKYLDYLAGIFDYIEIFTNATLINNELIKYFKENRIRIAISMYSYEVKEHDKVTRQSGSWTKTNEAIRKLQENGIKYTVKNVLMKGVNIGKKNTDLYTLSEIKDVVRLTGRASKSLISRELAKKRLITKNSMSQKLRMGFVKRCLSGHNCFSRRLYFACDLTVYPCVMERRFSHGNLRDNNLSDILNYEILSMNKDRINECRECEFRYCCFDCRDRKSVV